MAFTRSNYSIASHDWKRDTYAVALVGPESVRHHDLVARSGYRVVMAEDGASASDLFAGEPVDVIVLDFALGGRPPEAVLLFSRRTSSAAPVIALVPADKDDGYRRAFLAGARDVLPTPARGEDLLAAVDLVLEPRALAELVERLRGDEDEDGGTVTGVGGPQAAALTGEIERLRRDNEERVRLLEDDLDSFRRQALDAVTERDRIIESRANARRRLAGVKKELKEREAHLAMTEQACEALQRKLKDARDHRRRLEARTKEVELRAAKAQAEAGAAGDGATKSENVADPNQSKASIDRSITLAPGELLDALADGFVDPEEALMVRAVDERRLAELEDAYAKYQAGEKRIAELEAQLKTANNDDGRGFDGGETVADANALERQVELEAALAQRQKLESKVSDLEGALSAQADAGKRIAELESQLKASEALLRQLDDAMSDDEAAQMARAEHAQEQESHAETRGRLDAVMQERDALKQQVRNAEREVADALTRLDELDPLVAEVEQVRHELHAERLRHMATRRLFEHVSDENEATSASAELLRAQQEEERLERLFDQEKRSHAESKRELEHARNKIERVQSERDQMRVTVAALASDVAREASAEFARPPSRAGQSPQPVTGARAAPNSDRALADAPLAAADAPNVDDTPSAKLP